MCWLRFLLSPVTVYRLLQSLVSLLTLLQDHPEYGAKIVELLGLAEKFVKPKEPPIEPQEP